MPKICNFIENETPAQVFSCEFFEICENTFFEEHHRTTTSEYSSINSSEGEVANKTVNYGKEIKTYQFEPEE